MTKLLVAVIGLLVVAIGVLGFVLWDMKSRDSGLTVQLAKDTWSEPGYEVRMEIAGKVETIMGSGSGKRIPLVFTATSNGKPAPGLRLSGSVPGPTSTRFSQYSPPETVPDRRMGFPPSTVSDAKGQVKGILTLRSDGPGSIIPVTISVYRDKTKLGETTKTIRLE